LRAEPENLRDAHHYKYSTLGENLLDNEINHKAINALMAAWKNLPEEVEAGCTFGVRSALL
jgi:hypothetical protein